MIKQIKEVFSSKPFLFGLLAFLLPLLFYGNVLWGRSFGFDCAPGVMGVDQGYLQIPKENNVYCASIVDPGAYVWQHPAQWVDVIRHYLNGNFPIWTQHIGLGFPLAANFQSGAFFLLGFPFWLLFTLSKGNLFHLDLFFTFRYMMMCLGMYLFLRSFGVRRLISYIGGFAYFNIGYFIIVPNIAHHSVDMLLPFVAWTINKLYFTREKKWLGIGILTLGMSMLAGMPEASIFTLFFAGLYVLFLSIAFTKEKLRMFGYGCLLIIGGLFISSIIYIPGLEYLKEGMTIHHDTSGVIKSIPTEYLNTFVFPELFGGTVTRDEGVKTLGDTVYLSQAWNYIGFTITFFLISSLAFIPTLFKIKEKKWAWSYFFFLALGLVMVLQQFNLVHFFFFEHFPVFAQTQYSKYSSALLSFSLITAACLFLAVAIQYPSRKLLIGYVAMMALSYYVNAHYLPIIGGLSFISTYFGAIDNITYAIIFISVITAAYIFIKNKRIVLVVMLCFLILEMYSYLPKEGDMARRDSITAVPPGIRFLMQRFDQNSRILGIEDILYPNLADLYNLNDMRMLDAIWTKRTFIFYKTFFYEPDAFRVIGINEKSGKPVDIINNPFFDLFSVKYLLSYSPLESFTSGPSVKTLMENRKDEFTATFNIARFTIYPEAKDVVFMHAPGDKYFTLTKPAGAQSITFYPMIDPTLFNFKKGDGVTMRASFLDENGNVLATNMKYINPSSDKQDQKWKKMVVGPLPNKDQSYKVQLHLETLQRKNNEFDGAGWAGFYWDHLEAKTNSMYKQIYNGEFGIYERQNPLPRIHFVNETHCIQPDDKNDFKNEIQMMKKYAADIRNTAIIEDKYCSESRSYGGPRTISNQKFQDNTTSFTYSANTPQYIVLQDAYYPGWNVYINGKKASIDPVNITFRGVQVPAGENIEVVFKYQPFTFFIGLVLSLVGTGYAFWLIRSKKQAL